MFAALKAVHSSARAALIWRFALNSLIIDCQNNYQVAGQVSIPYLNGVTMNVALDGTT